MKQLIGNIGIDAGVVWIGDPCYIIHQKTGLPKTMGANWVEFCQLIDEHSPVMKSFCFALGHEGLGVCASTGYGDGTYPVYAEISDAGDGWGKRIRRITIEFDEDSGADDED